MRKTASQRKEAFLADFKALLEKHTAEFYVTADDASFGDSYGTPRADIIMGSQWDSDDNEVAEFVAFDLFSQGDAY